MVLSHRRLLATGFTAAALALSAIALVPVPADAVTQTTYTSTFGANAGDPIVGAYQWNCSTGTYAQTGIGPQSTTAAPFISGTGLDGSGALVVPATAATGYLGDLSTQPVVPSSATAFSVFAKGSSATSGQLAATMLDASLNTVAIGHQDVTIPTSWTSYDLTSAALTWDTDGSTRTMAAYAATHSAVAYVVFDVYVGDYYCDAMHQDGSVAFDDAVFAGQTFNEKINWEPTPSDSTQPTILSTSPAAGATMSGPFSVSATPSTPPSGINAVEFTLDGNTQNPITDYGAPFGFSLSGMTAGQHTLSVRAQSGAGVWGPARSFSFTYSGPLAPTAPSALTAMAGSLSAQLSWTAPTANGGSPITGYAVETSTDGGNTWSAPAMTGSTGTSYTVSGLNGGHSYVFRVAAVNAAGTGAYSAASGAVVPTGTSPACASAKAAAASANAAVANADAATSAAQAKLASLTKLLKKAKKGHNAAKVKKLTKQIKAQRKVIAADAAAAASAASAANSANAAVGSAC